MLMHADNTVDFVPMAKFLSIHNGRSVANKCYAGENNRPGADHTLSNHTADRLYDTNGNTVVQSHDAAGTRVVYRFSTGRSERDGTLE